MGVEEDGLYFFGEQRQRLDRGVLQGPGTSKLYFPFPYLRLTSLWGMTALYLDFLPEGPSLPRACGLQVNGLHGWSCLGVVLPPQTFLPLPWFNFSPSLGASAA